MNSPLFTIITVCYNAEATIKPTISSVKAQNYRGFEYIIIDGASKDNTLKIIDNDRDIVSTLVSEPDCGIYHAMNKGIDAANGEYLIFLNAGDRFHSANTLNDIAKLIGENRPDIIYGDTAIVNNCGDFIKMRRHRPPTKLTADSFKMGMLVCHQAFWVRRNIALKYNLRYRFSADFDWCVRVLKESDSILNCNTTLVDYLNEGATTRNRVKSLIERFNSMCHHYGIISTVAHHTIFLIRGFRGLN